MGGKTGPASIADVSGSNGAVKQQKAEESGFTYTDGGSLENVGEYSKCVIFRQEYSEYRSKLDVSQITQTGANNMQVGVGSASGYGSIHDTSSQRKAISHY